MTSRQKPSFLQSRYWQSFQEALGHQTLYLDGEGYSCLAIKRRTKLGDYLLAPYGPSADNQDCLSRALVELKQAGKDAGAIWVRVEPRCDELELTQIEKVIRAAGGKKAARNFNPAATRLIDLSGPPEQIFAGVSATNRSLIRRNDENQEITFATSTNPADVGLFNEMIKIVESRNKVHFYSADYYAKQAEILMPAGAMYLEFAYLAGKAVGSIVIHQLEGLASYTYAASLPEARDKNVSALLAWQAIKNAKARGASQFDLFGVAPSNAAPNHPWQGFSAFKAKFGGQVIEFAGTWDLPISPRYNLYRLAKKLK